MSEHRGNSSGKSYTANSSKVCNFSVAMKYVLYSFLGASYAPGVSYFPFN